MMFDCYEDASRLNVAPEFFRTESATRATQHFWRIYELGLVWAEDIHRGVYRYENSPEIVRIVEPLRDLRPEDDSWLFEEIGRVLEIRSDESDFETLPEFYAILDLMDESGLDQKERQHVLLEMTRGKAVSSIWSEYVHAHIFHVIFGSASELFSPVDNRHGEPRKLYNAKFNILREVRFRQGAGLRKSEARRVVGDLVGVSEYTLKNWESELKKVGEVEYYLHCAELAGFWSKKLQEGEGAFELRELLELEDDLHTVHYGFSISYMIEGEFRSRQRRAESELRLNLREARLGVARG
tara:strand:- start:21439 stop:22329 length:891 start_codon:yes stop_codon:yes gene_type:complete